LCTRTYKILSLTQNWEANAHLVVVKHRQEAENRPLHNSSSKGKTTTGSKK
jgi:hypothetical protein